MRLGSALGLAALVAYALAPDSRCCGSRRSRRGRAARRSTSGSPGRQRPHLAPSRAAAMAGWNAITGARGIVAAFTMSILLQIGIVDVTSGLLLCAAVSASGSSCTRGQRRSGPGRRRGRAVAGDAGRPRVAERHQLSPRRVGGLAAARRYDGPMRLTPWEEERLLIFTAAELARRHRAPGLRAQRARGDRAHVRRHVRGGPGRRDATPRSRRPGARPSSPDEVMPGVRELDRRCAPRGPARRRHAADRAPRPAGRPRRAAAERARARPRRRTRPPRRTIAPPSATSSTVRSDSTPGRSGSPRTSRSTGSIPGSSSTATQRAGSASTCRPARPNAGRPARRRTVRLVRFGGDGGAGRVGDPDDPPLPGRAPRALRPEHRRPRPPRRHRPVDPRRRGSPGARRRADLGLREDHPARARPGRPGRPSSMSSSPARSSLDPVIGVVKADIGIKDGRIVGVGRAGNAGDQRRHRPADRPPHPADHGLRPDRDPGAIDSHVHRSARRCCPPRCRAA